MIEMVVNVIRKSKKLIKGTVHEKVGEMRVWGVSLGHNIAPLRVFKFF
jgi:hypothetical protein